MSNINQNTRHLYSIFFHIQFCFVFIRKNMIIVLKLNSEKQKFDSFLYLLSSELRLYY